MIKHYIYTILANIKTNTHNTNCNRPFVFTASQLCQTAVKNSAVCGSLRGHALGVNWRVQCVAILFSRQHLSIFYNSSFSANTTIWRPISILGGIDLYQI